MDKNSKCDDLNEYLRGVSYKIDPIKPIIVQFNRATKKVHSIVFPELDPYDLTPKKRKVYVPNVAKD